MVTRRRSTKSTSKRASSSRSRKSTSGGRKSSSSRKSASSRGRKTGSSRGGKVEKVMHEYKHGDLKSGGSGRKVKSRKQAIAIGLSEARKSGEHVPKRKSSSRSR